MQADPYPYYAALRRESPVHYVESLQAFAVSRHADVRRVMHDHATFSNEAMAALVARPVEYAVDGRPARATASRRRTRCRSSAPTATRTRGCGCIVNRGFTPRRIGRLEEEVRRIARRLRRRPGRSARTATCKPGSRCRSRRSSSRRCSASSREQRDDFRRWSEHMVRGVFEPLDAAEQAAGRAERRADGRLARRRRSRQRAGSRGDDLISVLLRAEAEGGALTHDELRVFVFTLLVAGSITTAYLIGDRAVHRRSYRRVDAARPAIETPRAVDDDRVRSRHPAVDRRTAKPSAPTTAARNTHDSLFRTATPLTCP